MLIEAEYFISIVLLLILYIKFIGQYILSAVVICQLKTTEELVVSWDKTQK